MQYSEMKMTKQKQPETLISGNKKKRERIAAKVNYPRVSLSVALTIPRTIWEKNAGNPMTLLDISQELGHSPTGSTFSRIIISANRYGLILGSWSQQITKTVALSDLGKSIVSSTVNENVTRQKLESLLKPRTYEKVFNAIQGKVIPPQDRLANELVRIYGVAEKDKNNCCKTIIQNIEELGLSKEIRGKKYLALPDTGSNSDDSIQENSDDAQDDISAQSDTILNIPAKKQMPRQIFVAHGKNKQPLEQLKIILDQFRVPYKIAIEESNKGRPISKKISDLMHECSSSIFIFTKDEEMKDKDGNAIYMPSDNVVFELGAASILYGNKIVIFKQDGVKFGSDFTDLGHISFKGDLSAKTMDLMKELIDLNLLKVSPA